jgi:hypothetical protein
MKLELLYGTVLMYKRYTQKEIFDISHGNLSIDAYYDTEFKAVCIDRYKDNKDYAAIDVDHLVRILAAFKKVRSFKKIELTSGYYYGGTGEEIMKKVDAYIAENED